MTGIGFLGFCGSKCEVEKTANCYASNSHGSSGKVSKHSRLQSCVFPFKYNGKEYKECAPFIRGSSSYPPNRDTPICATAVEADGSLKYWGYCLPGCPKAGPANQNIKAVGGKGSGQRCVFPFYYNGKWNVECVPDDGKKWCPTKLNSDSTKVSGT